MHLRHDWKVLGHAYSMEPDDYTVFARYHDTTTLNVFCRCGKVKTVTIAHFKMTNEQISQYVAEVYG